MKCIFLLSVLLPVLLFAFGCGSKAPSEPAFMIKNIGATEAKMLVHYGNENNTLTILDVRTPREFKGGHLENAINVDFKGADFAGGLAGIDKEKDLLLHCASGGRSTACLDAIKAAGFQKVFRLDGGIKAWRADGNPITK